MSNYINQVSDSLKNHISELANNPCLFLRNPNVDFSRKRKIDFKTFIGIMMNSGGATMSKELLDFFDVKKIKEIYHLRWGIETSFRELKYAIGLTSFHARKPNYTKQEIYARLLLYNYCELITTHVIKQNRWTLQSPFIFVENISVINAILVHLMWLT